MRGHRLEVHACLRSSSDEAFDAPIATCCSLRCLQAWTQRAEVTLLAPGNGHVQREVPDERGGVDRYAQ